MNNGESFTGEKYSPKDQEVFDDLVKRHHPRVEQTDDELIVDLGGGTKRHIKKDIKIPVGEGGALVSIDDYIERLLSPED